MKIAVACDGPAVSPHFGRCERFLIAEATETDLRPIQWLENPGHEPGLLPRLMREHGVECVLAGGAGPRAVGLLNEAGIRLVMGVSGDPAEALLAFARGELAEGETTCEH